MSTKKLTSFNVMADLKLNVSIVIDAGSLEDAISKARTLKEQDFVDILGDFNDGELKITGVFE